MKKIRILLMLLMVLLTNPLQPLSAFASEGEPYLLEVIKPSYTQGYYWEFSEINNPKLGGSNSMTMGGVKYFNGFKFGEPGKATFTLNQQYGEIKGFIGLDDFENKKDTAVSFYADGKMIHFIELKARMQPQPFTIDVRGVKELIIEKEKGYSEVDFTSLKITTADGTVPKVEENKAVVNNDGPLFLDTVKTVSQGGYYWPFGKVSSNALGGNKSMTMAGTPYYDGFKFGEPGNATYDLEGKYGKLTGIIGLDDFENKAATSVNFIGDGVLIKSISLPAYIKPAPFEINVTGVHQLKIEKGKGYAEADLANLRILSGNGASSSDTQVKPVPETPKPADVIAQNIVGKILGPDAYRIKTTKKPLAASVKGNGFAVNGDFATTYGRQVVYQNNRFITMGDHGLISASVDGINWTPASIGTFSRVNGLAFGSGKYLAVAENGYMALSTNLKTWTEVKSPVAMIKSVIYNGKQFVILAENGVLYQSTDGKNITKLTQALHNKTAYKFTKLVQMNNQYFLMGDVVTLKSSDLKTWTRLNIVRNYKSGGKEGSTSNVVILDMTTGNKHIIAATQNDYFVSADNGVTWTQHTVRPANDSRTYVINSVVYHNNMFIMFLRIIDGTNPFYMITRADSKGNLFALSPDGAREDLEYNEIKSAVIGGGLLVGVGSEIIYSKDGNSYKSTDNRAANYPTLAGSNDQFMYYSNNELVTFNSNGKVGEAKTALQMGSSRMNDMAWGNGVYIAVGAEQTLIKSKDLKTWSAPYVFDNQNADVVKRPEITSIEFYNNGFIAADRDGNLYKSQNGDTWTVETLHKDYRDLTIQLDHDNQIMLYGAYVGPLADGSTSYVGLFLTSKDGSNWQQHLVPSVENIQSVAYGANGYVFIGLGKNYAVSKDLKYFGLYTLNDEYKLKSSKGNPVGLGELRDAVYYNNRYYMLATSTDRMNIDNPNLFDGRLLSSVDGVNWAPTQEDLLVSGTMLKLINGKLWFVAQNGMLIEVK